MESRPVEAALPRAADASSSSASLEAAVTETKQRAIDATAEALRLCSGEDQADAEWRVAAAGAAEDEE